MSTTMVRINEIEPNPLNPRKHFDEEELGKLADSIKQVGVLEPLLVTDKWWVNMGANPDGQA